MRIRLKNNHNIKAFANSFNLFSTLKFTMYHYDLYIPLNDLQIKNNT